ncbi:hypothetical protein [Caballeronia sp. LZ034LL]|uniref:hypothetical protein n=1 Tax=Caballeronia sp. LZ034LL TaxID=3038567 RepID=UPI00285E834B|nr:hypothetical protein [Caballeronia sp. LZ034LL]MDR5839221.1 hypothetical protein [Caballeronia sp. LZ034LL]
MSMLSLAALFLFKRTAWFDDSFIYLHIATNIVEAGTARYFPIAHSSMLLASSPLHLLTLVPGLAFLDLFHIPLRSIAAARFSFLSGAFVSFFLFLPFWLDRIRSYLLLSIAFFLLSGSLDSTLLMEGGVLFLSLFTLIKLLADRSENIYLTGIVVCLVGLSRPEIGLIATCVTACVYGTRKGALLKFSCGLLMALAVYAVIMLALKVYPVPSTIWSKEVTSKLKLFNDQNALDVLPEHIAQLMGFSKAWIGWVFIAMPLLFSLKSKKLFFVMAPCAAALLLIAHSMSGSFDWYSENFLIVFFALWVATTIELRRSGSIRTSTLSGALISLSFALLVVSNYSQNKYHAWNEDQPIYSEYREVASDFIGQGAYRIAQYSPNPVHIRTCEIGLISYFSGNGAWIFDVCGLAQVGNLKGASNSWLRHLYPKKFGETGEDQLLTLNRDRGREVIDVWALSGKEKSAATKVQCGYTDDRFCINRHE